MTISARPQHAVTALITRSKVTTLRFDSLATNAQGTLAIPDGYGNLQWDRFAAIKRSDAEAQLGTGTGYSTGNISGGQVAFFSGNAVLGTISSGSAADFAVRSVYLTSAYRDNETVTITGYDDGVVRHVRTVTVSKDAPLFVNLAMNNVDRVVFSGTGGVPTTSGAHVVLDDLRVITAPGSIGGTIFNDRNGDGVRNGRDEPIADRPVYIDANANGQIDPGERRTLSAADGSYGFGDLPFGEYDVRFAPGRDRTATTQEIDHDRYGFAQGRFEDRYGGSATLVTPLGSDGEADLDEGVYAMNLTTPIELWGNSYSRLYVSVNGLIEFDGASDSNFQNTALPDATRGPLIAPFWADLTFERGGDLLVVEESATGRIVVLWSNVQYYTQATITRSSFMVEIDRDGTISFNYFQVGAVPTSGNPNGVTIGVEGDDVDGASLYSQGMTLPSASSTIVFTPYLEQTYGAAHVVVDAGSAVTGVDFGATRLSPTAFGGDRWDGEIALPTHWSPVYAHNFAEQLSLV